MTMTEAIIEVGRFKPMSEDTLRKHFRKLGIKPQGKVRQCPQRFPDDSAERVLKLLGFKPQPLANHAKRNGRQLTYSR